MAATLGINEMRLISGALSNRSGYPFENFVQSFLKRRIIAFFEKYHLRNVDLFLKQINSKLFLESLLYFISVDTTEMFRDPGFWRSLRKIILSDAILKNNSVWFPDIGSGEELFSFLILLDVFELGRYPNVFFHHPSSSRIDEIRSGMIKSRNIETHNNNFKRLEIGGQFEKYCNYHTNSIVVSNTILKSVFPKKGWFLSEPDNQMFGLIFFRNSMLYMDKSLQDKVFQFLYNHLVPGGYIVIGAKENVPVSMANKLLIVDEQERIFRKPA
ncbi:MAG: hypothetical protein JW717_09880 [Marinilabiliaceae bacterium]|nr:hypothetical protein [Marinilabiliaceae bacterium]